MRSFCTCGSYQWKRTEILRFHSKPMKNTFARIHPPDKKNQFHVVLQILNDKPSINTLTSLLYISLCTNRSDLTTIGLFLTQFLLNIVYWKTHISKGYCWSFCYIKGLWHNVQSHPWKSIHCIKKVNHSFTCIHKKTWLLPFLYQRRLLNYILGVHCVHDSLRVIYQCTE